MLENIIVKVAETEKEELEAQQLGLKLSASEAGACAYIHSKDSKKITYFLVKEGETTIGTAIAYEHILNRPGEIRFSGMFIKPENKHSDIATALGWYMLLVAQNSGIETVTINIPKTDRSVSYFSRIYGFEEVSTNHPFGIEHSLMKVSFPGNVPTDTPLVRKNPLDVLRDYFGEPALINFQATLKVSYIGTGRQII